MNVKAPRRQCGGRDEIRKDRLWKALEGFGRIGVTRFGRIGVDGIAYHLLVVESEHSRGVCRVEDEEAPLRRADP